MRKIVLPLLMSIYLCFLLTADINAQDKTDPVYYGNINWVKTNNDIIRYSQTDIQKGGNKKADSVSLKVLGSLDEHQNLISSPFDAMAFESFHGIEEKKYAIKDISATSLQEVMQVIPENGTVYVRYQKVTVLLDRVIISLRVYFKDSVDVAKQKKEVAAIAKLQYTDSVRYYTKEEEEKLYLEAGGDESWKSVLDVSPFPAVAEVFIKPQYINEKDIPVIVKTIEQSKLVSSVEYPRAMKYNQITQINQLYQVPFILKIQYD